MQPNISYKHHKKQIYKCQFQKLLVHNICCLKEGNYRANIRAKATIVNINYGKSSLTQRYSRKEGDFSNINIHQHSHFQSSNPHFGLFDVVSSLKQTPGQYPK